MKKRQVLELSVKPDHEKLPWPGLKAEDHLSRVIARRLKEAKESKETEMWAEAQIARVLRYIQPETAIELVFGEARRRNKSVHPIATALLKILLDEINC
jgi:hypothetical protein